jgi:hypothetical protein
VELHLSQYGREIVQECLRRECLGSYQKDYDNKIMKDERDGV